MHVNGPLEQFHVLSHGIYLLLWFLPTHAWVGVAKTYFKIKRANQSPNIYSEAHIVVKESETPTLSISEEGKA
jgi:hypothetical protein